MAERLAVEGFQPSLAIMQYRQGFEKNIGNIFDCQNAS